MSIRLSLQIKGCVPDRKIAISSIIQGSINRSTLVSSKSHHVVFWVSKISRVRVLRIGYKLPVLSYYVQSLCWVPRQPSEHIRCTKQTQHNQIQSSVVWEMKQYAVVLCWLPVERTPGTRWRPGMSVGIDWTNHALHCAEPEPWETGSNLTKTKTMTTILRLRMTFIFLSLSRWLWNSVCVYLYHFVFKVQHSG